MSATPSAIQRGGAKLRGAVLRGATLRDADLEGADLSGADLGGANLSGAKLLGAVLRGALLDHATLSGADLRGADLRGADLTGAKLYRADLNGADLRDTNLEGANLNGAILTATNLAAANLAGADLRSARLPDGVPVVPRIDAAILAAIGPRGERLDMFAWHPLCGATHCRAGWAVTLAGDAGRTLEERLGLWTAAALIYTASTPGGCIIPDWSMPHAATLADLRQRAAETAGDME